MTLAFSVFLVSVLDRDFLVHKILTIQVRYGFVRGLEVGERDEPISFRKVCVITSNLTLSIPDI